MSVQREVKCLYRERSSHNFRRHDLVDQRVGRLLGDVKHAVGAPRSGGGARRLRDGLEQGATGRARDERGARVAARVQRKATLTLRRAKHAIARERAGG